MRHFFRAGLLVAFVAIGLPAVLQAQRSGSTGTGGTHTSQPIPDFSRINAVASAEHVHYQDYDNKPITFTSTTQYVLVPVVVTDKDGKPIAGLTKNDFQLLENGKPQPISSIEEITKAVAAPVKRATPGRSSGSPIEFSNTTESDRTPRRLVIIALDLVNSPFQDQSRARRQLVSYLAENIEPGALYQLVVIENNGLRVLHDYTQDPAALVAALKNVQTRVTHKDMVDPAVKSFAVKGGSAGTGSPGATDVGATTATYTLDRSVDSEEALMAMLAQAEQPYAQMIESAAVSSTLTAFQQIAERASGVPGRKSLIWITGAFPFSISSSNGAVSDGVPFGLFQHVMHELSNQMISVYPVDIRGLLTTNADASQHLTRSQNAFPSALLNDEANRQRDALDTMRTFADMTGGRAFFNTNDTKGAIREAAQDGQAYYLLSYPVDKSNRRAGWRKISVKSGNYRVRAREGYFLTQNTLDPINAARYDIETALTSPFDYTGLPMRLLLQPPAGSGDKRKITFAMMMPPKIATIDSSDTNHLFVEIAYAVMTPKGDSAAHKGTTYNLHLNPVQLQQVTTVGVSYGDTVELSPGAYKLRVVMRDNLTGKIGSVLAELNVK